MRSTCLICFLLFMNITSSSLSAASLKCNPNVEVLWSYDPLTKTSELQENVDNLSGIKLFLDAGFLKFPKEEGGNAKLFQQNSITRKTQDPLQVTIRYESSGDTDLEKTLIIISDPMCRGFAGSHVSVFNTLIYEYRNIVYTCDCLSPIHDIDNFIYHQ